MALAEAVKQSVIALMNQRGYSQRRLARELGWGQQYAWRRLSVAEGADKELTPSEIELIAQHFGVPVSKILPKNIPARST